MTTPTPDNVCELFPGGDPRVSQLSEELQEVVNRHAARGYLTEAALLGCLTALVLDAWASMREGSG
jgi:hypothetical protein